MRLPFSFIYSTLLHPLIGSGEGGGRGERVRAVCVCALCVFTLRYTERGDGGERFDRMHTLCVCALVFLFLIFLSLLSYVGRGVQIAASGFLSPTPPKDPLATFLMSHFFNARDRL